MKFTKLFFHTLREDPGEAEIASHKLMLRAGLIRRLAAGVYAFLPLGCRTVRKIENIIREEMNRAGAQELLMPALQPLELWEESGRLDTYTRDQILFTVKDRADRRFALGPTHEEIVTDIARSNIRSWRDMPFNLYQIQTKFRDEIRPRFGVMRGKEFTMKDAYSFDADPAGMNVSYEAMYAAYCRIFSRAGLDYRAVEADSGAIGGDASHEFMVLAEAGEDMVASCTACSYAANTERAEIGDPAPTSPAAPLPLKELETPDAKTIAEVTAFLNVTEKELVKTLIYTYTADGSGCATPVAALVRGDHVLNETKLKRALGAETLEPAGPETIEKVTGAPVGFAGPAGIAGGTKIIIDKTVAAMSNFITGGNRKDLHVGNVNPGRDFTAHTIADIRVAEAGDPCPRCKDGALRLDRGIEVGHVFKLGTKYSKAMKVAYTDPEGAHQLVWMGCYGIGVARIMAAAIEQHNDADGIAWPVSIAPYEVAVIPVSAQDETLMAAAEKIHNDLNAAGVDAALDDRPERPGVKFKDADLIGFPIKIVVGKMLKEGKVEVQLRESGEKELVETGKITARIVELIKQIRPEPK